jgi:2-polyprenyl-3-methyl-5-hydroxy-6-metoxy-1,4-benzoquinol methylase
VPFGQSTQSLEPNQLGALWELVEMGQLTPEDFQTRREELLGRYRATWTEALLLKGRSDLQESLLAEVALYLGGTDLLHTRQRCRVAGEAIRDRWNEEVAPERRESIEHFYDESEAYIYDLMWWHTLVDDDDPLAYVVALNFGRQHGCGSCLDFGAGVGSGNILFCTSGFDVTGADISSVLLDFSTWRLELRGLPTNFIDTKVDSLPKRAFDMVMAMDTFEHLVDPVQTVEELWQCLKPGGFLLGRFHADSDHDHPQHIVHAFEPTFERMKSLGFVEVWRDNWLWGHRAFQKSA